MKIFETLNVPRGIYNSYNKRKSTKNLNLGNIYNDFFRELRILARFD